MNKSDYTLRPKDTEAEVSIFGPGFGECLAIHIGLNEWIVVDSCINSEAKQPAALRYFSDIGIDPANQVVAVVVTHWHDDHVNGLDRLFTACESAQLVLPIALLKHEFLDLISAYQKNAMMVSTGVSVLTRVLEELEYRTKHKDRFPTPKWAIEGKLLWKRSDFHEQTPRIECEIHSLSPSDTALTTALTRFNELFPTENRAKNRIPTLTQNDCSVGLHLKIGNVKLLLGADLQTTNSNQTGWMAILNSTTLPSGKSSFFKVPHHGSSNADHPRIWRELLDSDPVAVTTPWQLAGRSLPKDSDLQRLRILTNRCFITTPPIPTKAIRRPSAVRRTTSEAALWIREVESVQGHIRSRCDCLSHEDNDWNVELFGNAVSIQDLV